MLMATANYLYLRHSISWLVPEDEEWSRTWDELHALKRALHNLGWTFTEEVVEVKLQDDEDDFDRMLAEAASDEEVSHG
jgi:hypothetical protein